MKKETTKDRVLNLLEESTDKFISGEEIAGELSLTRGGVWKAIKALKEKGYVIEAVTNKGYRLMTEGDVLSKGRIDSFLCERNCHIDTYVYESLTSTNDVCREYAGEGASDLVVIADYQTKGRGRRGRSFFSPTGTGIYMSFLLHPSDDIHEATLITCMAAVALCRAIEEVTDRHPSIKWVNDVFVNGKKISGILTEGLTSLEEGKFAYIIVGIGINVYEPEGGFPEEIKDIAGTLLDKEKHYKDTRNKLCAALIDNFLRLYQNGGKEDFLDEYRKKSFLIGENVRVMQANKIVEKGKAKVLGIDDECRLTVEYEDGTKEALFTGEVSVVKE